MCWLIIADFIKLIRLGHLLFFFFTHNHDAIICSFLMWRHTSSARYMPNITFQKGQELSHCSLLIVDALKWGQLTYDSVLAFCLSALRVYQCLASHVYLYPRCSYWIFRVYQALTFHIYSAFCICLYSASPGISVIQAKLSISLPLTFYTDPSSCL